MKRQRIDPPYKAYALHANGTRRPLDASGIVVEVRPGIEIEIDFAPHPNFSGHLTMLTPPCPRMKRLYDEGKVDDFAVFFGAANVLHLWVERRIRGGQTARKGKSSSPSVAKPMTAKAPTRRAATSKGRRGSGDAT